MTNELKDALDHFRTMKECYTLSSMMFEKIKQEKAYFLKNDLDALASDANIARLAKEPLKNTEEWQNAIELDVKITSAWEVAHVYWEAYDLLRTAEHDMFEAGIAVMQLTGQAELMKANNLNMEFFDDARRSHLHTIYPQIIKVMYEWKPGGLP